jgi:hypothetical protein
MIMIDAEEAKRVEKEIIMREIRQEEAILSSISDEEAEFERKMDMIEEEVRYIESKKEDDYQQILQENRENQMAKKTEPNSNNYQRKNR